MGHQKLSETLISLGERTIILPLYFKITTFPQSRPFLSKKMHQIVIYPSVVFGSRIFSWYSPTKFRNSCPLWEIVAKSWINRNLYTIRPILALRSCVGTFIMASRWSTRAWTAQTFAQLSDKISEILLLFDVAVLHRKQRVQGRAIAATVLKW